MTLPHALARFIGEPAVFTNDGWTFPIAVFDWQRLPEKSRTEFLSSIFGDCELGEDYAGLVARGGRKSGGDDPFDPFETVWISSTCGPFALAELALAEGDDGSIAFGEDGHRQFGKLFLLEGNRVWSIEVDGTALPRATPVQLASHFRDLDIRSPTAEEVEAFRSMNAIPSRRRRNR